MYIQWELKPVSAGLVFYWHQGLISEIDQWASKYQIEYKTKFVKDTYRLILKNEQAYTHFALSWDPNLYKDLSEYFKNYKLIEPMKIDKKK